MTKHSIALLRKAIALIEKDGFKRAGMGAGGWGVVAALDKLAEGPEPMFAVMAAAERIRKIIGQDRILDWELDPARTQDEVLAVLRKAAAHG